VNIKTPNAELDEIGDIFAEAPGIDAGVAKAVSVIPTIDPDTLPWPQAPFRGILFFRLLDWRVFLERERETERIENMILMYRAVLLYGRSGCGKSSLLNAGILPRALRKGMMPERIRILLKPEGEISVERILLSEKSTDPAGHDTLPNYLPSRFSETDLNDRIELSCAEFLARLRTSPDLGLPLLIFDQFEEFITLFEEEAQQSDRFREAKKARSAIEGLLDELILGTDLKIKLVFAFRDDYFARLTSLFERYPRLLDQSVRLESPGIDRLPRIVLGPFEPSAAKQTTPAPPWEKQPFTKKLADTIQTGFEALSPSGLLSLSEVQTLCLTLWEKPQLREELIEAPWPGPRIREIIEQEAWAKVKEGYSRRERIHALAILSTLVTTEGTRNVISEGNLLRELRGNLALWVVPANTKKVLRRMVEDTGLVRLSTTAGNRYYELQSEFLIPWVQNAQKGLGRMRRWASFYAWMTVIFMLLLLVVLFVNAQESNRQLEQTNSELFQTRAERDVAKEELKRASESNRAAREQETENLRALREQAQAGEGAVQDLALILKKQAPDALQSLRPRTKELVEAQLLATMKVVEPATTGQPVTLKHDDDVWRAVFSGDGKQVATASADKTVKLWRLDGTPVIEPWQASSSGGSDENKLSGVTDVAIDPQGRFLISGSAGRSVRVYDLQRKAQLAIPEVQRDTITAVAFSSTGEYAVSASADQTVLLWKTKDFVDRPERVKPVATWKHRGIVTSAAFSASGRWVVTSCDDGYCRIWDTQDPAKAPWQWSAGAPVRRAMFLGGPNETDVLGVAGKTAFFWLDPARRDQTFLVPLDSDKGAAPIHAVASPDGSFAAVATSDGKLQLWKVPSEDSVRKPIVLRTQQRARILRLAWSSKDVLAAAGEDGTVQLWRQPGPENLQVFQKFQAHQGPVWWISFSQDGEHLATTSAFSSENLPPANPELAAEVRSLSHLPDNSARIWKVP
jgi:WD40 repeat protein